MCHLIISKNAAKRFMKLFMNGNKVVRASREQYVSTSETDSIAKAVVFYAGGQYTLKPTIS